MSVSEFIDTYSDDLGYLEDAWNLLIAQGPVEREAELCFASLCRVYAVLMVGGIEAMIEHWQETYPNIVLRAYPTNNPKITNEKKIEDLCRAFLGKGAPVDRDVFADFLAIKYLRNTIVHARKNNREIKWLTQRGFPQDTRLLNEIHFRKMKRINEKMMIYIAATSALHERTPRSS